MKVKREGGFIPITITLENLNEARLVLTALIIGNCHMPSRSFLADDCAVSGELIRKLQNEGITKR